MPLILGTNSIKDTGYNVANSLRYNGSDVADSLTKSISSTSSATKSTYSAWVKRSELGRNQHINYVESGGRYSEIYFNTSDQILIFHYHSSTTQAHLVTSRVFRDFSAWYHIVVAFDSTQGTASNRIKLYVNGVQETSFGTETYPGSSADLAFNTSGQTHNIGNANLSASLSLDGYLAEVCWIDGQQLAPTSFGEFDEDSPTIWKPIDVSGLTFGTNGFYLDFEDSSALGNDAAGSNNFTVNNLTAIDQTTDTCTNNFATFNPLIIFYPSYVSTLSDGNLTATRSDNGGNHSTIMPTQGKWYAEFKCITKGAGVSHVGAIPYDKFTDNEFNAQNKGVAYRTDGKKYIDGTGTTYGDTWGAGDIISIALNLDDGEAVFYKNGTAQNSGTAITGFTYDSPMAIMVGGGGSTWKWSANFGNPPYSISSGNADGNGYGNFEYAVPSGYYSLNTKNLAEYG